MAIALVHSGTIEMQLTESAVCEIIVLTVCEIFLVKYFLHCIFALRRGLKCLLTDEVF